MTVIKFCRLGDGRTVSYREQGKGPTLVMLHGWGMSSVVFESMMQPLAASFRILAPDLRGHGRSDPGPGYDLAQLSADVEEWLSIVDAGDICLLGWSLGGQVALELAQQLGSQVKKLILISTTPCFVQQGSWTAGQPSAQIKILARQFKRDPRKALESFITQQFEGEELDDSVLHSFKADIFDAGPLPAREAGLGGLETLSHVDLRSRRWRGIPSLSVHGSCDTVIPPDAGRYLALRMLKAQWVELEGVGHAPFVSQTERCVTLVKDFLA